MEIEKIAEICHEVNRALCISLGDYSQENWYEAPEWQRVSARAGVDFHQMMPDAGPEASHESWMNLKRGEGWVYGETKDPEKKTHPCLLPFYDLPKEQQLKDHLFTTIVKVLS